MRSLINDPIVVAQQLDSLVVPQSLGLSLGQ